jgi:uncharacterized membrane protein YfcA
LNIVASSIAISAAGVGAGVINSVAGGGTMLSFPVLLWAGRDPIVANASNALALWSGSLAGAAGFRRELWNSRRLLALLVPPALVGGAAGGWLLLRTPSTVFSHIVPYLVALATLLMALQRPLKRWTATEAPPTRTRAAALIAGQLAVSFYGGYFGAGMGILMLAALGFYGVADIHARNGLKNILAALTNGVASIYFAIAGAINWRDAALLGVGSVLGGYAGASLGRKLRRETAERIVVIIGLAMTVALFVRR